MRSALLISPISRPGVFKPMVPSLPFQFNYVVNHSFTRSNNHPTESYLLQGLSKSTRLDTKNPSVSSGVLFVLFWMQRSQNESFESIFDQGLVIIEETWPNPVLNEHREKKWNIPKETQV